MAASDFLMQEDLPTAPILFYELALLWPDRKEQDALHEVK
jgi:hypothetical protein